VLGHCLKASKRLFLAQALSMLHKRVVPVWLEASLPRVPNAYSQAGCLSHISSSAERCPRRDHVLMHLASSMPFKLC
jgi:hypothetical protein